MDDRAFLEFCQKKDAEAYAIMMKASQEYAAKDNKFENFDQIAMFFNAFCPELGGKVSSKHIAIVYFLKHFVSIMKGVSLREDMSGRYQDSINYLRLMFGMYERERTSEKQEGDSNQDKAEQAYRNLNTTTTFAPIFGKSATCTCITGIAGNDYGQRGDHHAKDCPMYDPRFTDAFQDQRAVRKSVYADRGLDF